MEKRTKKIEDIGRPDYDTLAEDKDIPYDFHSQSANFKVCDFWFEAKLPNEQLIRASVRDTIPAKSYLDKSIVVSKPEPKNLDLQEETNYDKRFNFSFRERFFMDDSWFNDYQEGRISEALYDFCHEVSLN